MPEWSRIPLEYLETKVLIKVIGLQISNCHIVRSTIFALEKCFLTLFSVQTYFSALLTIWKVEALSHGLKIGNRLELGPQIKII